MTDIATREFLAQVRRSVATQRRAMERAINTFSAAAPSDCRLALDTSYLTQPGDKFEAQRDLYHRGWRLAFMTASNVGDHLSAVGDVAATESPRTFAHMTLARAALEAAARVNYLLDSQATVGGRVLRAAALMLASAEEERRAVKELTTGNATIHEAANNRAEDRYEDLAEVLARAGISTSRGRDGVRLLGVRWHGDQERVASSPNISALLRDLLPHKPAAYRVGSGATHSQPWVLDDDSAFDEAARRLQWRFDPAALAGSVDLAITAASLTIEAFAGMLGQDPRGEQIEAQRREEAVSRLVLPLLSR